MKIILDCEGGDHSPLAQIEGAVLALKDINDLRVILVGKSEAINSALQKYQFDESRLEVLNANDIISCDDKPTQVIREKKESSLVVALDLLKNDSECVGLISSGSTGAVLAGAVMLIGRIKGVSRPALSPLLPTIDGGRVMLVDCGANTECKPVNLMHFALMGDIYFKHVMGIKNPKIALLSNGTENEKGNELTKQAYQLIKTLPNIDFCGNVEAREILSGKYNVIVSDGFSGNIALKSCEGAFMTAFKIIKNEIKSSFIAKIGALFMSRQFKNIKKKMDYNSFGGAIVLGAGKIVIKAHGSASAKAIYASLIQAHQASKVRLCEMIKANLPKDNIDD